MSEENEEPENDKEKRYNFDYTPKVKVDVKMQDQDYEKLKEEKEGLEAQLTNIALQKFDEEKAKLLRICSQNDRQIIENINEPSELEYWRGRYHERLEGRYSAPPEQPGQASMREYSGLKNMTFDSPQQMGEFLLKKSMENTSEGKEAREMLTVLRRKFGTKIYDFDKTVRFEVPYVSTIPNLAKPEKKFPTIKGKNEKSDGSSFTKPIMGDER